MNNKIENKKVEVPQTKKMNDKDYITTILTIEKAMVKDYATALTEASNNDLYNDYLEMFNDGYKSTVKTNKQFVREKDNQSNYLN